MYFSGTKCRLLIASSLVSVSLFAKDAAKLPAEGMQKPLCFVENKGQVLGADAHTRTDIHYRLAGKGLSLYLGDGQLLYQFRKAGVGSEPTLTTYNMDVTLVGANKAAKVTASNELEYFENYYLGQLGGNGITAHAFQKVTYHDVYPNIDWVVYINNDKVEYDFVVKPGGDPSQIQLKYGGATKLEATADGGIVAGTPMGEVAEHKPVAFETATGKPVSSAFRVHDNVVSFETGNYLGSLTIDPYLQWSTYFGGASEDVVTGLVTSTTGNSIYACGYTSSTSGIASAGAYQNTFGTGIHDAFVCRFNATGAIQWATYYGSTGSDSATGVTADANSVYIVGATTSATNMASAGSDHNANQGNSDIFVAKFSGTTGTRTWATYEGGTTDDFGTSIVCSPTGGVVYAAGITKSTAIATAGAYQTTLGGTQDGYLMKFSSTTGAKSWATYFGGTGDDEIGGVTLDATGNVYICGLTNSLTNVAYGASPYQATLNGTNDAYVASFTSAGAIRWGTYYGGSGTENGCGIAADAAGNIYVVGSTTSSDVIATPDSAYQTTLNGLQDAFLVKLTSAGNVDWGTYFGGNNIDYGKAICVDLQGNITIAGGTFSTSGLPTSQGYQTALSGDDDAYFAKFNSYGQVIRASYFGNAFYDFAYAVTSDIGAASTTSTATIIGGLTSSTAGISSTGAYQTAFGGGSSDGFITKFYRDTLVKINQPYKDTLICPGGTLTVAYTTNFNFAAGNVFSAQLSDATGSFAAPVTIGTVTATTSGNITCTIPAGTTPGTAYRIRLHATAPAFTSPDDIANIQVVSSLPSITMSGTTPVCVGQTIAVGASASYAVTSYSWSGPAAFSSTLQNPTVTTSATTADSGVYSVTTTHNGCPAVVSTIDIAVSTFIPPAPLDSAGTPICAGTTLNLFSQSGMAGTFTYYWTGPAGFTSTDQNPVLATTTTANSGTYYVMDTLAGCPSPVSAVTVVINPVDTPNITVTAVPGDTVCEGTLVTFNTTISNAGVSPGYQWMNGSLPIVGAIFGTYSSAFLSSTSQIYCILTNDIACPDKATDTSNVVDMTVLNNTPIVEVLVAPDSVITPGTTAYFNSYVGGTMLNGYQWYVNGVAVLGADSSTFILSDITTDDTVTLQVMSNALCASTGSGTVVMHVYPVSVANVAASLNNISLFPNPNNGSFSVEGFVNGANNGSIQIDVTNAIGQVVYNGSTAVTNGHVKQQLNLGNVPAGVYMLRLNSEGQTRTLRFTIQ